MVGHWRRSPLGPIDDVMWAPPGTGERVLVAATQDVVDFVGGIYQFDRHVVTALDVCLSADGRRLDLLAPELGLEVHMEAGRGWRLPLPRHRPTWFTRWVERPIARRLMGVEAYGVSPAGFREWYQASRYRPLRTASASRDGTDLGRLRPLDPPTHFGFSEPPRRPSMVEVTTVVQVGSGGALPGQDDRLPGRQP